MFLWLVALSLFLHNQDKYQTFNYVLSNLKDKLCFVTWFAHVIYCINQLYDPPDPISVIVEARMITREVFGLLFKVLLKEGKAVAALCAVFVSLCLIRKDFGSI